jgi:hypothetical protein
VQVHFWRLGEPAPRVGYTTNISTTGMFIATNSPLASGARIRVEVIDRDRGFMVEGIVAHAKKLQVEMTRLGQSGMGVRFLTVEELVRELMPAGYGAAGETEEIPPEAPRPQPAPPPPSPPRPEPPSAAPAASPAPPQPPVPDRSPAPAPVTASGGSYTVRFSNVEEFLEVYKRDILQGGLFVSTLYPARLQETVSVEIFPPLPYAEPLMVRARVVQRFEPQADSGLNLLSGMGLELMDLPALVERLEPVMQRLRNPLS